MDNRDLVGIKNLWLNIFLKIRFCGDMWTSFEDLKNRYNEGYRAYHTFDHLCMMFKEMYKNFNLLNHFKIDEGVMLIAIFYHDAVYDPKRNDNEEKSVEFFKNSVLYPVLSERNQELVIRMILDSKHISEPSFITSQLFCDLDLSILGQEPDIFDKYENNIRTEYSFVSESDYRKGRIAFLSSLLKRENIYSTADFREKYENKARKNIKRLIGLLSKDIPEI